MVLRGDAGAARGNESPDSLSNRMQPGVERGPKVCIPQCCVCPSAFGMSTHNDLLYFQMGNGILDHASGVDIVSMHTVGDVAVHKQLAWPAVADGSLRYAAVGAPYPQNLGRLALG